MLRDGVAYRDLRGQHFDRRDKAKTIRRLVTRLIDLVCQVEVHAHAALMRRLETICQKFVTRRHTALLIAIAGMFAVRPLIGETEAAVIVFSLATLLVLLAALLTIRVDDLVGDREALLVQRRRRRVVGWALAVPAIAERLWMFFAPSSPRLVLVGSICLAAVLRPTSPGASCEAC